MSAVLNFQQQLVTETCFRCGIVFAVPQYFKTMRLADATSFFCPNGHGQAYVKSEADKLREQLEKERLEHQRRLDFERNQTASVRRELTSVKGQLTKTRKRVSKGVCPCCNRSFAALERHIKTKHPDYAELAS